MATKGSIPALELRHRLLRCVQCGVRADALSAGGAEHCPRCGCDLLARPPRSYAEMEGLQEPDAEPPPEPDAGVQARIDAAAGNWVLLLCLVAVLSLAAVLGAMVLAA